MIADLRQYQVAFFRFLQQFLFMIFSISFFIFFKVTSLSTVFLFLFMSSILVLIFVIYYYLTHYKINFSIKKVNRILIHKLVFVDGIKYFLNGMSTILLLQIDVLLIDYLYGSASAGIYLVIWKIPNTIIMLGWRLSDPFSAVVAKGIKNNQQKEIKNDFFKFEKKIVLMATIAGVSYMILGKYILDIWIGSENIPNIEYMYIVPSFVVIVSIIQRLYLSVNYYTEGLGLVSILQFIEILFKIIFIVFFFDYFYELAPVVGWLVGFVITIWFYRRNSLKVLFTN
jgi:O-antigen/teichoic acid export membrane protein